MNIKVLTRYWRTILVVAEMTPLAIGAPAPGLRMETV